MVALLFGACDEEMEKVTISSDPISPALTGPGENAFTFVLADKDNLIEFTWDESDFGFDASITYSIEAALGTTFADSVVLLSGQGSAGSTSVDEVNTALLGLGLPIGELATVYVRVVATINDHVEALSSEAMTFKTTPYETIYPVIYVPGAYQGWSPGAEVGRLYSYGFNSVYEGILRIVETADNNGEFKLTPEASWDEAWGGSLTLEGKNYSGTTDGGDNFKVEPGTYKLKVDVNAQTISLEPTDDWGIIGDATPGGWDADTDMTYNGQKQAWEITTDLLAGELKFRANDGWDLNYGDTGADGTIEAGGDNIAVTAGNYTIRLDLNNEKYELIIN